MKAVEGMDSYNFTAEVTKNYSKRGLPFYVTEENFILKVDYAYSGKLPADASIRISVGKKYAGKTLYYSEIDGDVVLLMQRAVVDKDGYITITQEHCSSYIVTLSEVNADNTQETQTPSGENNGGTQTPSGEKSGGTQTPSGEK